MRPLTARCRLPVFAAVLCSVAALHAPLQAQDLRWVQRTRTEFGGALGALTAQPTGLDREVVTTLHGSRMRIDDGALSTIQDLTTLETLMLDHGQRTFTRMAIDEMGPRMAALRRMAGPDGAPTTDTLAPLIFSTDETDTILGLAARRSVTALRVPGLPMAMPGMSTSPASSNHWVMNDMWSAVDFPGTEALADAGSAWASRLAGAMGVAGALPPGPAHPPGADRTGGLPLIMVSTTVVLPDGVTPDLAMLLDLAARPVGGAVLSRMTTEVTEVSAGPADVSFEVPGGYTERRFPAVPPR